MILNIIIAFFTVCGIHFCAKVLWHTFTSKIDRRQRKEYNDEDMK